MKILRNQILTGQLFSLIKKHSLNWADLPGVSLRPIEGGWSLVTLSTEQPLLVEEDLTAKEFTYEYFLRSHEEHIVFVSNHHHLVGEFIRLTNLSKLVRKPSVAVDRLVKELSKKPHLLYTVSRVYANVEGYGRKLRTMSLFGDDLVDVSTFQELLPILVAHRAELRNVRSRMNVLCMDIEGAIDFYYRGKLSLQLMLEALSYLSTGVVRQEPGEKLSQAESVESFINW